MKKLILSLLVTLLALAGCDKKDPATYSGMEAGFLSAGIFTTDNGTRMTIVGNEEKYDVSTARRALVSYTTHPITDPGHINIDLLALMDAGILLPSRTDGLDDTPAGSPVQVTDAWFSAGYLNLLASFQGKEGGKHRLSTTYTADADGMVIRLLHESTETVTAETRSQLNLFLSIPMDEPVLSYDQFAISLGKQHGTYPAPVLLQWTARTLENGPLTLYERKGSYTPPVSN